MTYPNTDYLRVGLSPRWVFAVLSAPTTVYFAASTGVQAFTTIAGDSAGFTVPATVRSLSDIIQECDWFSGLQAASGFNIQLNDDGGIYSNLVQAAPQTLIGKTVVLYIYFAENIPSVLDSTYEVWRGYVDDFSFDESSFKLSCEDGSLSKVENKKIPNNDSLIEEGTYVPADVVGKVFPVVYGAVDRSPIIMTKDKRDSVIHIGVCTGYTDATNTVSVTWISTPFPTLNSLANKYLKVIYGTDKSDDLTGDGDKSLVDVVKKIVSNTAPSVAGVGSFVVEPSDPAVSAFPQQMRDWVNSDTGVVLEILDADIEYSGWRFRSTDNFDTEGFQSVGGVVEPVFTFDTETKKFLQLDSTQYVKTTTVVGGHTQHVIDFNVSYLIGRDQLNLIVDYVELGKIFNTTGSHSIQQFDAGNYVGHEYEPEDNSVDDDLTTAAILDTGNLPNTFNINSQYKEIHWDLLYLYKYLQESNREQINFSRVFLTVKLDWHFYAVTPVIPCGFILALRTISYDHVSNEAGNTPPTAAHILDQKYLIYGELSGVADVSGSLYAVPAFIDTVDGNDATYRENRIEFEGISDIKDLINKHAALILWGGTTAGTGNHREVITIYSVGLVFEKQIALADAKEFYGNIKGRKDFVSSALISAGTYQDHPAFCAAHALIAENGFVLADFDLDFSDATAFAFTMIEQIETLTFLEDVAKQSASKLIVNKAGIWSNPRYDSTKTFKVSGTNTPADLDIFDQTGAWNTGTGKFTKHPILSMEDIKLTPTGDCYSNFVVSYNYNYASKKFDGMLYIYSDGTTNLVDGDLENHTVANLQTLIAASPADNGATLKLELNMVRDRVTAGTVLERYLERLYKRWWTFTFRTWWGAFEHSIGEIVNVRHQMLTRLFPSTYTTKRWEIVEKTLRSSGGVDITVAEN